MGKRILIVGGVAGGASAACRIRRLDAEAEIIIFERGPHVSFSNCALPYHLSGIVKDSSSLVLVTPETFRKRYQIEVQTGHEVTSIDRENKTVTVKDTVTGEETAQSYDKLVLSPGASPVRPRSIEGIGLSHVFTVRNVVDIEKLKAFAVTDEVKDVAVIGGGFIGVEVAENLVLAGRHVTLIEAADQILTPFDPDMVQLLHKEMLDNGVTLVLGDGLKKISEDQVETVSGKCIPAQAVVLAIGVAPETALAKAAGLAIGSTGGILVNHNYQTSDPDIYAVGDAIELYSRLTHKPGRLALAGPAQRQARAAADSMYGLPHSNRGFIGSSVLKVFGLNAASTGLNEKTAGENGIPCDSVYILPTDKVKIMPESSVMHFKLVFEVPTGRVLGAQAIGKGNVDKRVDVIAAMIAMGATLEDLKELELCYSPVFGTAKDVINQAALVALNILYGRYRQVPVTAARKLVESGACIIDVREKKEFANGHLLNARNIPLSELTERLDEIPKDIPVYLHCRSGQRSYFACMALINRGYRNVFNMAGSFLGICCYEYYQDTVTGRDKIVTEYNFK